MTASSPPSPHSPTRVLIFTLKLPLNFENIKKNFQKSLYIPEKIVYSEDHKKGSEGDSVLKNPTERRGHRLRAASGGRKTIGNTLEPDVRTVSRTSRECALSIQESEKMKRSFTFQMRVVPREYPVPECRKMFRDFFDPQEIPSYE